MKKSLNKQRHARGEERPHLKKKLRLRKMVLLIYIIVHLSMPFCLKINFRWLKTGGKIKPEKIKREKENSGKRKNVGKQNNDLGLCTKFTFQMQNIVFELSTSKYREKLINYKIQINPNAKNQPIIQ